MAGVRIGTIVGLVAVVIGSIGLLTSDQKPEFALGDRVALASNPLVTGSVIRVYRDPESGQVYDIDWDDPANGTSIGLPEHFLMATNV